MYQHIGTFVQGSGPNSNVQVVTADPPLSISGNTRGVHIGNTGIVTGIGAGTNVTIDNTNPAVPVISSTAAGGVTQLVAGSNITLTPSGGTGVVTVAASGGGGGGGASVGYQTHVLTIDHTQITQAGTVVYTPTGNEVIISAYVNPSFCTNFSANPTGSVFLGFNPYVSVQNGLACAATYTALTTTTFDVSMFFPLNGNNTSCLHVTPSNPLSIYQQNTDTWTSGVLSVTICTVPETVAPPAGPVSHVLAIPYTTLNAGGGVVYTPTGNELVLAIYINPSLCTNFDVPINGTPFFNNNSSYSYGSLENGALDYQNLSATTPDIIQYFCNTTVTYISKSTILVTPTLPLGIYDGSAETFTAGVLSVTIVTQAFT